MQEAEETMKRNLWTEMKQETFRKGEMKSFRAQESTDSKLKWKKKLLEYLKDEMENLPRSRIQILRNRKERI